MQIQHEDDGQVGRFFIEENGQQLAEMYYEWHAADHFTILHTEVDDSLGGRGVGKQLMHHAIEYAREKGVLIRPVCPFAKKVMEGSEEYRSLIFHPKNERF